MATSQAAQQAILLMSAEDDPACTIVPRLIAAEADLARIQIASSAIGRNGDEVTAWAAR